MSEKKRAADETYWKKIVAILTAGWIAIWIYRTSLTPIYSTLSAYFGGVSNAQLGLISSFYFLGYVIMQIPSGLLVDRFGQKKVIIPGFSLFALGVVCVMLSKQIAMMNVGSVIAGVGCGTFYGCAYSLTAENVPQESKSLSTAIVNSGMAVGSGIGLISSSYLVGNGIIPWQGMMVAVLVVIACMLFVFSRVVRSKEEADALRDDSLPVPEGKTDIHAFFGPQMVSAYILYFSTMYAYYLIDTWLPNFLETERGFAGTAVGVASSLVFFAAIPGALVFSRLADKMPDRKVLIIISLELIAAAMLLFMITMGNQVLLVVGIVAYGFFGKLAVEPIIISWLSGYASSGSVATMYGFFNFFGMMSSVVAPTITGALSDATGTKLWGFYLAIAIILVGTFIFFLVNRGKQSQRA